MDGPLPKTRCPSCLYPMDDATEMHGDSRVPSPKDFGMCVSCGQLLVYKDDLTVRAAEPEDELLLCPDQFSDIRKAQAFIRKRGPIP